MREDAWYYQKEGVMNILKGVLCFIGGNSAAMRQAMHFQKTHQRTSVVYKKY